MFLKNQIKYWLPVYIYAAIIFYLSSQTPAQISGVPIPTHYIPAPVKHIAEYGIFTLLLWRAMLHSRFRHPAILAAITAVLYGFTDELHQYFVPGRTANLLDLVYDSIGAIIVQPIIGWFRR